LQPRKGSKSAGYEWINGAEGGAASLGFSASVLQWCGGAWVKGETETVKGKAQVKFLGQLRGPTETALIHLNGFD